MLCALPSAQAGACCRPVRVLNNTPVPRAGVFCTFALHEARMRPVRPAADRHDHLEHNKRVCRRSLPAQDGLKHALGQQHQVWHASATRVAPGIEEDLAHLGRHEPEAVTRRIDSARAECIERPAPVELSAAV